MGTSRHQVNAVAPTYIETPMVVAVEANRERIPIWLADTPMGRMELRRRWRAQSFPCVRRGQPHDRVDRQR